MTLEISYESSGEEILLYFDTKGAGLNSQTFGNALIHFDELCRAIDAVVNPNREIEVDFVRSDQGSIRAIFRVVAKDTRSLLSAPVTMLIMPFLLGILVNRVTSDSVNIVVNDSSYIVEYGNERVVLPKSSEIVSKRAERDPSVSQTLRNFFVSVDSDPDVKAVDFRSPRAPDKPVIPITRDKFAVLRDAPDIELIDHPQDREVSHHKVPMTVLTAVLEKSKRKWQFLWAGQKVYADIRDDEFFEKLANHEYEFGQGDVLTVDLVVSQRLNEIVGAYENVSFHVTKVHDHARGPKQGTLL
ncbi:hypothetical protein [Rhodopseudomonas telluris]|uniref:Uncharacterized protein n=1 Tax=Rhodopseudomonas telluris TaxID=644215 RepID=A0ABV6EQS9_9BRAD